MGTQDVGSDPGHCHCTELLLTLDGGDSGIDLKHEASAKIPGATLNIKNALDAGGAVTEAAVRSDWDS